MITVEGIKGQSFGVFGLGATGIASAEALVASGAEVYSWDENAVAREKTANTPYRPEHPRHWPWDRLEAVVLSPGVPLTHPRPHAIVRKAVSSKVPVIGDVEIFARCVLNLPKEKQPRIIAVTGSNGKSTTTSLIAHILRETGHKVFEGGNLGEAVLSLPAIDENTIYVLELSSFQLDLVHSLKADIAVFLNISPDHLERHGDIDGYVKAKRRIFNNQSSDDYAVIGVDDAVSQTVCTDLTASQHGEVIPVSAIGTLGHGVFVLGNELFFNFDNKTRPAGDIPDIAALKGQHNHQNAAAAFAVTTRLGVSPPLAMLAMSKFRGLAHRMEKVGEAKGVTFINDSKATNVDAVLQALRAYKPIYWLAGGKAKEGGISALVDKGENVRKAYFYGEAGADFNEQWQSASAPSEVFTTLDLAVAQAFDDALQAGESDPVILLSPAAASYDQYANFEARGDAFRQLFSAIASQDGEAA